MVMRATPTDRLFLLILFVFLQTGQVTFSQTSSYPLSDWVKKLNDKNFFASSFDKEILFALKDKKSSEVNITFNQLEQRGAGEYFNLQLNVLRAIWLATTQGCNAKPLASQLLKKALNAAYETDDELLVSNISWRYGEYMYGCEELEQAAMYCLYATEIDEKIGREINPDRFRLLGVVLYNTRDYEKSIYYTRRAIEKEKDTSSDMKIIVLSRWNTIGLCWQKIGMYDSAFFYFNIAMKMAIEVNSEIWKSIIAGNMGQVYYLQKKYAVAKPLLEADYRVSKAYGEFSSAGNSLQWVARINLLEGKRDSALLQIKEAMQLVQKMQNTASYFNYYQNVCYAAADVYGAFGNYDSVYKYSQIYNRIHDSLERSAASSRLEIARIKLDNLQNALTIKNLHKEKEAETLKRNFILAFLIMFAVIVILVLTRQRQRLIHKQQLALKEKAAAEVEFAAARDQLNMFKQNIIEKTSLIEKLQDQVHHKETNAEHLEIVDEISRQTILTEEDWDKFKKLFEKIYPGFFTKLKEKAPDITIAEQRMAALTRLHLTTKQIASMLGISVDSVHKTRQRLRQRLHIAPDINLEETIAYL
jgi:hypothetical protein